MTQNNFECIHLVKLSESDEFLRDICLCNNFLYDSREIKYFLLKHQFILEQSVEPNIPL